MAPSRKQEMGSHLFPLALLAAAHLLSVATAAGPSVIVVGAGLSGISAAKTLSDAGITKLLILEATNRIGGRICKVPFAGINVEKGANWVEGVNGNQVNPIWTLANQLGLRKFYSNYDNLSSNTYKEEGGIYQQVGVQQIIDTAVKVEAAGEKYSESLPVSGRRDISILAAQRLRNHVPSTALEMVIDYYKFDYEFAEPPRVTSLQNTVPLSTFSNFGEDVYFVADQRGYESVVHNTAHQFLKTTKDGVILDPRLQLNKVVRRIQYYESGVTVTTEDGSVYKADYAVVSVSLGVLQSNLIQFMPALPHWKLLAIYEFDMAVYTKIFLKFPYSFWPAGNGTQFFLYASDRRGYYPVWQHFEVEYPGAHVLLVTVTDEESRRIEQQPDSLTKSEAMEVLRAMFGKNIPEASDILVPRWWSDRFYRGTFSNWPIGVNRYEYDQIRAPVGRIYFTGEHTSEHYNGYVHGAYLAEGMMESDLGKLFIGGISWDTDEERLREYFKKFGEVVEAVIMKDRHTGRARGFGFVVFSDPAVADRVVSEKHLIDGRMVEAKKAVPRDDQQIMNRNNNGVQNFSGPGRTKKIFVGGLASTVTDVDFRKYFEQFGAITDVVVMYDHNTQRPRGFGFITFDSEDAVEKVLHKTFHQLNGKMVEVKKAVPKELSPGPNLRLPIGSYNLDLNRVNSFLNGYSQGYNPSYIGSYPMRMDGRFGPLASERKGFHSFNPGYGIGMNYDPVMSPSYGGNSNYSSTVGYGRALSPYSSGNSSRFGSPIGYSGGSGTLGSSFTSAARSLWGNGVLNYNIDPANSNSYISRSEGPGGLGLNWGGSSSTLTSHGASINTGFIGGNLSYGSGENSFSLGASSYGCSGRSSGNGPVNNSFTATNKGYKGNYTDSFCNSSIYGDPTWESASSELDGSSPFGYGLGAAASNITAKGSPDYLASFNVTNRHINGEG